MTDWRMAAKKLHLDFWACNTCALLLALLLAGSLLVGLAGGYSPTQAQAEATGTANEPPTLIGRWDGSGYKELLTFLMVPRYAHGQRKGSLEITHKRRRDGTRGAVLHHVGTQQKFRKVKR
jgi:hypothetical protein